MAHRHCTRIRHRYAAAVAATTAFALTVAFGQVALAAPEPTVSTERSAKVGEYEPNDVVTQATDLGLSGTTVIAAIETPNDVDLFEFYVVQTGSQVFFPITNTTPTAGSGYTDSIKAEIRDAGGTVLTESGYGDLDQGESKTVSYSLTPGRYYLAIESEYSSKDVIRSYSFTVNGSTVSAATMQGICTQAQAEAVASNKRVGCAKKALHRAGSPRAARKARAKLKAAKRELRAAERRSLTYCVVL